MKKKRPTPRLLALLLAVIMSLSALPWRASAEETATWTEIQLADIQPTDTIAITMTKDSTTWLLPSGTTNTTPAAETAAVTGDGLTTNGSAGCAWTVTPTEGGYHIQNPEGKYLYVEIRDDGVRVGDTVALWSVSNEYLAAKDGDGDTRYLGVYPRKSDWRCYKNTTGHTAGQTVSFWKLNIAPDPEPTVPPTTQPTAPPATQPAPEPTVPATDPPKPSTIAEALAGGSGREFTVQGTVTLVDGSTIYIQDNTGGICAAMAEASGNIILGDTITATGKRSTQDGLPQLAESTWEIASGPALVPRETTIANLADGDFCTYVKLTALEVTEISGENLTLRDAAGSCILLKKAVSDSSLRVGSILDVCAAVSADGDGLCLRNTLPTELTPVGQRNDTYQDTTCPIARWDGQYTDDATLLPEVTGDKYTAGDSSDKTALLTVVAGGKSVNPYFNPNGEGFLGGLHMGSAPGDHVQLALSTAGWGRMTLSFQLRSSEAAPGAFQVQYSAAGGPFQNFTTGRYTLPARSSGAITDGIARTSLAPGEFITFTFDLPAGAENCGDLRLRLVPGAQRADGKDGAIGGNIRLREIAVTGSPIRSESITGFVTVTPGGGAVKAGIALAMTCDTAGAEIRYSFDGGTTWQVYGDGAKPRLETLPCTLDVYAAAPGKENSVVTVHSYTLAAPDPTDPPETTAPPETQKPTVPKATTAPDIQETAATTEPRATSAPETTEPTPSATSNPTTAAPPASNAPTGDRTPVVPALGFMALSLSALALLLKGRKTGSTKG